MYDIGHQHLYWSITYQSWHQHISSPTSVTNIDVADLVIYDCNLLFSYNSKKKRIKAIKQ